MEGSSYRSLFRTQKETVNFKPISKSDDLEIGSSIDFVPSVTAQAVPCPVWKAHNFRQN